MPTDLSVTSAAVFAQRHPATIRNWVASGVLPAYRVGPRDLRIRPADLEAVLHRPVKP